MKDNFNDIQQNKDLLDELFDGKFYVFVRSFVCAYHFLYNHTKNINKADKLSVALTIVFFDDIEKGVITFDMINKCLPGDSDIPLNDLITSTVIKAALTIDNETANNNEKALNESRSIIADEVMDAFSRATSLAEYKGNDRYNEILEKAIEKGYVKSIPAPSQEATEPCTEQEEKVASRSTIMTYDINEDEQTESSETPPKTWLGKFVAAFKELQVKRKLKDALGFFPFYMFFLPLFYYFPIEMILYNMNFSTSTPVLKFPIGLLIYIFVTVTDEWLSYVPSLLLWAGGLLCALLFANPFDPVTIGFYAILIIKIIVFTVRYLKYNSKKKTQDKQ